MVALVESIIFRSILFTPPLLGAMLLAKYGQKRFRAKGIYYLWLVLGICLILPSVSLVELNVGEFSFAEQVTKRSESETKQDAIIDQLAPQDNPKAAESGNHGEGGSKGISQKLSQQMFVEEAESTGNTASQSQAGKIGQEKTSKKEGASFTAAWANIVYVLCVAVEGGMQQRYVWKLISGIWVFGAILFWAYEALVYLAIRRKLLRWSRMAEKEDVKIMEVEKKRLGIRANIRLIRCECIESPMLMGIRKPTILLPTKACTREELPFVLRHELVHEKHRDLQKKVLFLLVRGCYWFHPLVHRMCHLAEHAMEMYCDETVIQAQNEDYCQSYSFVLLEAIRCQTCNKGLPLTTNLNGGKEQMKERFKNIMNYGTKGNGATFFAMLAMVCILFTTVSCGTNIEKKIESKAKETVSELKTTAMASTLAGKDKVHLLLVGLDTVNAENGRADASLLLTLDQKKKTAYLTDLCRSSYVKIKGYGKNKLGAVYALGGAELMESTVEENFGIQLDGCIAVDFASMESIIDQMGGIEVKLTGKEAKYLNQTNYVSDKKFRNLKAGKQTLNGCQALGYARVRRVEAINGSMDEFGRGERFGTILKAVYAKAKGLELSKDVELIGQYGPSLSTDVAVDDMVALATVLLDEKEYSLEFQQVPSNKKEYSVGLEQCGNVLKLDFEHLQAMDQIKG